MKKTVMIYGISSFVGSNIAQLLKDDFRVVGTYHSTPVEIPGVTCVPCDILKKDYLMSITGRFKPDFGIYCVGQSSLMECKLKPKFADALNTAGAANCASATERYGAKFVYLSSAFVMGGEDVVYQEGDTPFPNTVYGNSLSSAEFYIQRSCLNYLILRCGVLYGRSFNPRHPNWFEVVQSGFAKNQAVLADDSVYTGFLDVSLLVKILKSLLDGGVTNRLIQISSKDVVTRYQFAELYAKIFRKDSNLIQKITGAFPLDTGNNKTAAAPASQNYYFRLDTANVEELIASPMPKVEESLTYTAKKLKVRT